LARKYFNQECGLSTLGELSSQLPGPGCGLKAASLSIFYEYLFCNRAAAYFDTLYFDTSYFYALELRFYPVRTPRDFLIVDRKSRVLSEAIRSKSGGLNRLVFHRSENSFVSVL